MAQSNSSASLYSLSPYNLLLEHTTEFFRKTLHLMEELPNFILKSNGAAPIFIVIFL